MADFQLKVTAETQDAEKKLQNIDKVATEATRERPIKIEIPNYSQLSKNLGDLKKDVADAANTVKQFYRVTSQLPVGPVREINEMASQLKNVAVAANDTRKNMGDAGDVIRTTLDTAGKAAESLVGRLTRVAFSLYVINQAVQAVNEAFSGMFKATIGREVQLRETILKTQTTLASTNKVFRNGQEITDPYQKIVSLTGEVAKHIDSIRERSIALAGVTSNDVIEVFGIVASQVGQIGGGLKEAEDLAINFSAALGTFGIPLYQARQEIGSILRGDITTDSYLAKALGITNQDIAKAKTEAGGVVKFLEDRLAASVAGQRIAAEGFAGVVSNIKDIQELVSQSFGRGLLDPLLDGLTKIFDFLFKIRKQLLGVSELVGRSIGKVVSGSVGMITGASGVSKDPGSKAAALLSATESGVNTISLKITGAIQSVYLQLATLAERASAAFTAVTKGLAALAYGLLSIKLEQFKALISVLETVSPALLAAANAVGGLLSVWGQFMQVPIVQFIAQIGAGMRVLEATGITKVISSLIVLKGIITWVQANIPKLIAHFNSIRAVIGGVIAALGTLIVNTTQAGAAMMAAWQPQSKALQALKAELTQVSAQLNIVGSNAQAAGQKLGGLANTGGKLGGGIVGLIAGMVKFQLIMFAITATISLVTNLFGKWKEEQDRLAADTRADVALQRLRTTYKNLGGDATAAQKRARDFEQAIVDANYARGVEQLEEVRKKINQIRYELKPGIQSWGEFWDALSGSEAGRFEERSRQTLSALERREAELKRRLANVDAETDRKNAQDNIRIEAQNRVNLEKEIKELQRQQQNELFQQRQALAQKEVEIFRAAGELRIFQMEQANAKLIEGEEGASAAALESLNNYLSTRERGELDIEAAKKSLVIEVANLEKEISNYRLENEKKIAEIRKRAGDYEQRVANYRREVAGQIAAGSGGGAATFGATGNVSNAAGWVHGHFQTNTGTLDNLIGDVIPVLKALLDQGVPVELSNGTRVAGNKDDSYYRQILADAARQHRHSGDGRSIDLFVPEGTKVPVPLSGITGNTGRGGITGGLPGSGKSWVGHLAPGSKAGGAAALTPPTAPNFDDIGAPAVQRYAEAVRGVASALERARALQEALTSAKTAAAFDAIAKAAFPKVALEEYDNQAIELQETLSALRGISAGLYDPEQIRIAVDQKSKELIADRERAQILDAAQKRLEKNQITQAEFDKLSADLAERQKQYNADLAKESEARRRNLELTKQQNAVESLKKATGAIRFDVARAGVQAQAAMAQAFAGDDSAALRRIEAEQKIAEERIRLEQDATKSTEDVNRELTAFAIQTRAAADVMGALDKEVKAFTSQMASIRDVSRTLVDSYKGVAKSFLSGGDLKEAVNQMSQAITDKLVGIVLDSAFKPMEDMFVKTLKDVFGMQDPTVALQEANNLALDQNTAALERVTTALASPGTAGPLAIPTIPFGGLTGDNLQSMLNTQGQAAVEATLEQSFKGIGESLTSLGTVAETTGKQADGAAKQGEQGFGKFLGAMTGVATGALAITGAIQAMQDSQGGTYGTLMGIAGILGGLGSIFGGISSLGKRAGGGPVSARRPYVVGEVGPELFIPDAGGTIVPNDKIAFTGAGGLTPELGGSPMASPFQQGGSSSVSNAFSTISSTAIPFTKSTERLVAERAERETVAAINNPKPLDVRFESQVINGVEYVTAEQHQKGMSEAAERGRALALSALQNSVKSRRQVGLA